MLQSTVQSESSKSFSTPASSATVITKNSRRTISNQTLVAALIVQKSFRRNSSRAWFLKLKNTVIFIQKRYRVVRFATIIYIIKYRADRIILQSLRVSRMEKMQTIINKQAAILIIQRWIRVKYWRKQRLEATLVLQKWTRRAVQRAGANRKYLAAIAIQAWIRRCTLRARKDQEYHAIVYIQRWLRGIAARAAMEEIRRIRLAALEEVLSEDDEEMVFCV
jgi:hypothetical protein